MTKGSTHSILKHVSKVGKSHDQTNACECVSQYLTSHMDLEPKSIGTMTQKASRNHSEWQDESPRRHHESTVCLDGRITPTEYNGNLIYIGNKHFVSTFSGSSTNLGHVESGWRSRIWHQESIHGGTKAFVDATAWTGTTRTISTFSDGPCYTQHLFVTICIQTQGTAVSISRTVSNELWIQQHFVSGTNTTIHIQQTMETMSFGFF
mmetsp:Transcript_30053/g.45991  ORF Transcript_30053/g.45991 Transcript_30053/m.45991 type:complete len:207 (+) Transcript_30053:208-828(+)